MIFAPSPENILRAVQALTSGELVAFPTETVYGLGANAFNDSAVEKIYALKGRPATNPLIVHVATLKAAREIFAESLPPNVERRLMKLSKLWPGPLSIVAPKSRSIPDRVTAAQPLIAVRIPNHPVALELLRQVPFPIAAPSANRSNYVSPTRAQHVEDDFGKDLEIILDGGECQVGLESTVVSISGNSPTILRHGGITSLIIEKTLEEKLAIQETSKTPISPGMQALHYSPHTPLYLRGRAPSANTGTRSGLIQFKSTSSAPLSSFSRVISLSPVGDLEQVAKGLYAALRELDQCNLDFIVIDECEAHGLGLAIMDRIMRAQGDLCTPQTTIK